MSAQRFRSLHHGDRVLFLPNVWDGATAALFARAGARAVATTSAALAWAQGYADGSALPRSALFAALDAVCRCAAGLPVSVDLEDGYSDDPREVAMLVREVVARGAVGINIEDRAQSPDLLVAKIGAIRDLCGVGVFINARCDVYLRGVASGDAALDQTVERAAAYERAGADGFYPIGLSDSQTLGRLARATGLPINVLAGTALPPAQSLYALGIRRVTAGPALAELAYGTATAAAAAFAAEGDVRAMFTDRAVDFDDVNALMQGMRRDPA